MPKSHDQGSDRAYCIHTHPTVGRKPIVPALSLRGVESFLRLDKLLISMKIFYLLEPVLAHRYTGISKNTQTSR